MQDAQSDIKKLQKQHKDNKEELNKAMAAMYKEKGINPLGCILPLRMPFKSATATWIVFADTFDILSPSIFV